MPAVSPYLNFAGKCEEAFLFYKSVFGGEFFNMMRFKDAPPAYQSCEKEHEYIMHVALPIGEKTILMGSDVPEMMGPVTTGNSSSIALNPGSEEEARRLFDGLSAGGTVTVPFDKAFWGSYFGMFIDKFGRQLPPGGASLYQLTKTLP